MGEKWASLPTDLVQAVYPFLSVVEVLAFRIHRRGMPEPLSDTILTLLVSDPYYSLQMGAGQCWSCRLAICIEIGETPWIRIPPRYSSLALSRHIRALSCDDGEVFQRLLHLEHVIIRTWRPHKRYELMSFDWDRATITAYAYASASARDSADHWPCGPTRKPLWMELFGSTPTLSTRQKNRDRDKAIRVQMNRERHIRGHAFSFFPRWH